MRLLRGGIAYPLAPSGTDGTYAYFGDDLAVREGDVFDLEVETGADRVKARTVVPAPPEGVVLSGDTLEIPALGGGGPHGGGPGGQDNALTVAWDNPRSTMHYVVVESTEAGEPDYILPDFIRERIGRFRLVTSPTEDNYYDIRLPNLEVLGAHRAIVYRVNAEYTDLYENREQDSRDLNEPPTNIEGGLGVFRAFNSRSVDFEVVRLGGG